MEMWVNKYEWERMQERLKALESRPVELDKFTVYDEGQYTVYSSLGYPWHLMNKQEIPVKEAVEKILAHLGLKLTYNKGTPPSVTVEKQPKSKA
jgi:hypothetical protein